MRRRRSGEEDSGIDITPMIDIVFIMLIFFVVTASFVKEAGLDVEKPNKMTKPPEDNENRSILVMIDEVDQVWVDRRPVDIRAVRANIERLRAENTKAGVVIKTNDESTSGALVKVMDAARQAGANVSLAP